MESHPVRIASLSAGVALAAALAGAPQQADATPTAPSPRPRLVALDQLVSLPVVIRENAAGGDHGKDTKDKEQEKDARGKDAASKTGVATPTVVGSLRDLIVDTETKQVTFAVVQTAEGGRAIPMNRLLWDDAGRRWMIHDRGELAKASPCDGVNLAKLHGHAVDASDGKAGGTGGTTERNDDKSGRAREAAIDARYDLATIFGRRDVAARDGRAGAGLGVVLEANTGWLAFLRVATDHGDVAVPCAALQAPAGAGAAAALQIQVAMEKSALAKAPVLGKDAKATLDEPAFRAELYRFFNVPVPAYERLGNGNRGAEKRN